MAAADNLGGLLLARLVALQVVDPDNFKGPIRLRLASNPDGAAQQPKPGTSASNAGSGGKRKAAKAAGSQRSIAQLLQPAAAPPAAVAMAASAAIEAVAASVGPAGVCVQIDTAAVSSGHGADVDTAL
jgi:hypothetical protein